MVCFSRAFVFILFSFASVSLVGCAISGSGNPVSTNTIDSNNDIGYVHEEQNVTVNYPEPKPLQQKPRIRRAKIKGKYVEYL